MKLGCGRGRQVLSGWCASGSGRSRGDGRRAFSSPRLAWRRRPKKPRLQQLRL